MFAVFKFIVEKLALRHASGRGVLQDSFESKKAPAGYNRGFDFVKLILALDAAVSIENVCKQLVHQTPFYSVK